MRIIGDRGEFMNKISQTIPNQFDTIFSPFKAEEFEDALAFLKDAGFTGVELAVAHPGLVDVDKLNRQVAGRNLSVTSISTGQAYDKYGISLSSFDEERRGEAVKFVKGHIDISERTGFPVVTVGLLRGKIERGDKASLMRNLKEAMFRCVEYASSRGVRLQLEPINRSETTLINNTSEALDFLEELGNPKNLGILYDTYHSNLEDGDMIRSIKAASGKIMNVHLADSHRGLPGYGNIDFLSIYETIQETGYDGAYALETLSVPSIEFVKEHCFESVSAFIK
jgi:sugar phosphate isomerase/epimerase